MLLGPFEVVYLLENLFIEERSLLERERREGFEGLRDKKEVKVLEEFGQLGLRVVVGDKVNKVSGLEGEHPNKGSWDLLLQIVQVTHSKHSNIQRVAGTALDLRKQQ